MQNMTESFFKKKNQLTTTKHCEKFSFRLEKYNKTFDCMQIVHFYQK